MNSSNDRNLVLITCARGLGESLKAEVTKLGFEIVNARDNGVEIFASWSDIMLLNLHLRTAFYVLLLMKEFKCDNPNTFYKEINSISWEDWISPDEYISITAKVNTPCITNTMFANQKAKDAVVDRIISRAGARPDSGSNRNNVVINIYWHEDRCWAYLNTSGQKLSDRGYRKMPHLAPMQETLAAATLMATGYDGTTPIVLPMCGSGTLAIEAALIALNKSPGLLRSNYGFMHLRNFDKDAWQEIRKSTLKQAQKTIPSVIIATDIDEKAVEASKQNALTAGVDHLIQFAVCDFADTSLPDAPGIIMMNPEYGERLGEINKLKMLYARIGDFLKQKCKGYAGYIFTGNIPLSKVIGLQTSRRIAFYNGSIECRLLKYDIYAGSKKSKYQSASE